MKLYYHGKVDNGKIILPRTRMQKELPQVFNGKPIKITVEQNKVKRSDQQNRYYWAVVLPYVRDGFIDLGNNLQRNGESIMLIHKLMKSKFLDNGIAIADANGEVHMTEPTTSTLNKEEFSEYVDRIKEWSTEYLNIYIPDANETT